MKKHLGIFIDLTNPAHVKWWNERARKLVHTLFYNSITETATNKEIGRIMVITGIHARRIFKENDKFLGKDAVTMTSNELKKYHKEEP